MKAKITAAVALTCGILVGLSGCDLFAPQETMNIVEASDGVSGTTGEIFVGNAVIITTTGKIGNLVVTLVNRDHLTHPVEIQHGVQQRQTVNLTVGPAASKQLGTPGNTLVFITNLNAMPGSLAPVYFDSGNNTGVLLNVPVLTGAQPPYSDLTPEKLAAGGIRG